MPAGGKCTARVGAQLFLVLTSDDVHLAYGEAPFESQHMLLVIDTNVVSQVADTYEEQW